MPKINELPPNLALFARASQHAMRHDRRHDAAPCQEKSMCWRNMRSARFPVSLQKP